MAYKGTFKPRNPEKYVGNHNRIIYRSRWELMYMDKLDRHPQVVKWASEELTIPYLSPVDKRMHRYYPDFVVQIRDDKQQLKTVMVEIKPLAQCHPPKQKLTKGGKATRRFLKEAKTYSVNQAKWAAAREYCADRGWKFEVVTERELGLKF